MLKGGASSYTWSQSDLEDLEPSPSSQSQSTSSNVSRAPHDGSSNRDGSGHQQSLSISLDFLKHGGDDEENLDTRGGAAQRGSSAWNTSSPRPTSLARHLSQKAQAQPHQSGSIPIGGGGGGLSGSPSHHQQAGSPFSSAHSDAHSPWANDHSSSWYRRTSNLVEASDPVVLSSSQRSNRERSLSRGAAWSHDGGSTGPNGSSAFGTSPHSAADVDATGFSKKTTDSPASESSFRHWPPDVHHRGHTVSSAALLRSQSASQSSNPAAMAASPNLGFVPWALNAPDPITRQSATVDGASGRPASRDRRGPSPSRSEAKDYSASPRVLETMPEGIEHHTFSSHGPGNGEQSYHPARHRQRASSSAAAFGTVAGDHDGAWMGASPRGGGGGDDVRRPAFADWPSPVRQHRDGHAHGHGHASWEDGAETARQSPVERKASLAHYGESPTSYQHAAKQAQQHQAAHPPPSTHFFGSESRRHSFSTPADSLAGGLTASGRRAVGFEPVCDTVGPTRSASVDRERLAYLESETPRSRVAAGGPRGRGGGLAFSEDDLATDLGQLNAELDKISAEQQEYDARAARGMNVRVPSSQAAATGVHASSMPPLFGQQYSSPPDWATVLSDDGPGRGDAGGWPRADDGYRSSPFPPSKSRSASVGPRGSSPSEVQREVHRHRAESVTLARSSESSGFGLSPNAKAFAVGAGGHRGAPFNAYASPFPHVGHPQQPPQPQQQQHGIEAGQYMPPGYPSPHHHHHGHPPAPPHPHHHLGIAPPPPAQPQPPMLNEWALHSLATLAPSAGGTGPGGFSASAANNNNAGPNSLQDLGRGVPLSNLPLDTRLYIVGFKQGRTDLFFKPASPMGMQQQQQVGIDGRSGEDDIRRDDLVIVEADRGKDVGRVLNDTLTVEGVRNFIALQANEGAVPQQQQGTSNAANGPNGNGNGNGNGPSTTTASSSTSTPSLGSRAAIAARSINPKRLYCLASPADRSLLASKAADEERALSMCIAKVQQRGLAMHVVAAELQWDRRKLTFYYTAASRVDFRALVADLFKIWKLRVWMFDIGGRRDQRDWLNLGGGGQQQQQQQMMQYGAGGHMMAGGHGGPMVPDWEVGPAAAAATAGRG